MAQGEINPVRRWVERHYRLGLWVIGLSGYVAGIEATPLVTAAKAGLIAAGMLFGGSEMIINLINNRDLERENAELRGERTKHEQERVRWYEERAMWNERKARWDEEKARWDEEKARMSGENANLRAENARLRRGRYRRNRGAGLQGNGGE